MDNLTSYCPPRLTRYLHLFGRFFFPEGIAGSPTFTYLPLIHAMLSDPEEAVILPAHLQ